MSATIRAELDRLLPDDDTPYALAFSGGGDSLALLKALADDPRLKGVLHVDHGLREESAKEAEFAATLATRLCTTATVLRWEPGEIDSGLQEKARRARYRLMGEWCRAKGVRHLVTAHHADDQAETVLMRLERGSGWRGASGMAATTYAPVWPELAGVWLLRPALGLRKADLTSTLGGHAPVDDPSNANTDFARVQARERLAVDETLRAEMLDLAGAMARGRRHDRERLVADLHGYALSHEGVLTIPRKIGLTSLAALMPIIGGSSGPVDRARLRNRMSVLFSGKPVALGYGTMGQWSDGALTLTRDPVAMTGRKDGTLEPTAVRMEIVRRPRIWDGRFMVSGQGGVLNPERRGHHVGYRILYRRDVTVQNLVEDRLNALLQTDAALMPQPAA